MRNCSLGKKQVSIVRINGCPYYYYYYHYYYYYYYYGLSPGARKTVPNNKVSVKRGPTVVWQI